MVDNIQGDTNVPATVPLERFSFAWHTAVGASDHDDTFSLGQKVSRGGG